MVDGRRYGIGRRMHAEEAEAYNTTSSANMYIFLGLLFGGGGGKMSSFLQSYDTLDFFFFLF